MNKTISSLIIVISGLAILVSFYLVGSPLTVRKERADEKRIMDLQNLQWQIIGFWQAKHKLPTRLPDLNSNLNGTPIPTDPTTNEPYDYIVQSAEQFSLCATFFKRATTDQNSPKYTAPIEKASPENNWNHPAGRFCFDRTIDPDFYPPNPKID